MQREIEKLREKMKPFTNKLLDKKVREFKFNLEIENDPDARPIPEWQLKPGLEISNPEAWVLYRIYIGKSLDEHGKPTDTVVEPGISIQY